MTEATQEQTQEQRDDRRQLDRLVAFSDGVFAIAITLLVLDLRLADMSSMDTAAPLAEQLHALAPSFFAYALSFVVVGGYWVSHHRTFKYIVRYDTRLLWLDLLVLFFVALLPFPTQVVARYGNTTLGVQIYAGAMVLTGLSVLALWTYAFYGGHLTRPGTDYRIGAIKSAITPAIFGGSMIVAIWDPRLATMMWWLVAIAFFVVDPIVNSDWRRLGSSRKKAKTS
jgi:uncharacterized membrane protein